MAVVTLGNANPVETWHEQVDAEDFTRDELGEQCTAAGLDTTGTKADLAARLSAVVHRRALGERSVTSVSIPDGMSLGEAFACVTAGGQGVWAYHSDDPAPAWVHSDDPALQLLLAAHFGAPEGEGWL